MNSDQIMTLAVANALLPGELISACESVPHYESICNDDNFWKEKTDLDYGVETKEQNMSWKDFYVNIYNGNIIPYKVFYNKRLIGTTYWLVDNNTIEGNVKTYLMMTRNGNVFKNNGYVIIYDNDYNILSCMKLSDFRKGISKYEIGLNRPIRIDFVDTGRYIQLIEKVIKP